MGKKSFLYLIAFIAISFTSYGQQVSKTVIAEHFTNTYCSICASRNPGLFSNLSHYPQVLHISYFPSSPYAACPLSMYNVAENDARTNYYGLYGATPQLVVEGNIITGLFTDPVIYTSQLGKTTSFDLKVSLQLKSPDSVTARIVVKKVDTSSITALQLYGAIVEDTLSFAAHNGESLHQDVFRKSLWGTTSMSIAPPVSVGDSSVYIKAVKWDAAWSKPRVYSIAILQKTDKQVVQAARSAHIASPTGISVIDDEEEVEVYPVPAASELHINSGSFVPVTAEVFNVHGQLVMRLPGIKNSTIDISTLDRGFYTLNLSDGRQVKRKRFIKL